MALNQSLTRSGQALNERGHGCLEAAAVSIGLNSGLVVLQPGHSQALRPPFSYVWWQRHCHRAKESEQTKRIGLQTARRNEWVTILDAALVESGLVDAWLNQQLSQVADIRWASSSPRRPRIHHNGPLKEDEHPFVVASGRVVELLDVLLDETNIDTIVSAALENDISALRFDAASMLNCNHACREVSIDNFATDKAAGRRF